MTPREKLEARLAKYVSEYRCGMPWMPYLKVRIQEVRYALRCLSTHTYPLKPRKGKSKVKP